MADIKYIDLRENDSAQYYLFPDVSRFSGEGKATLSHINELIIAINEIASKLSLNYIWHNEEFEICTKNLVSFLESNSHEPLTFYGSLNYGENIEDEWFLVYVLIELTKQIDGLIVQVRDADGEFLLIEAAEQLPSWITPETCEGRTFIYKGKLHVLPKSYKASHEECIVTAEILQYVKEKSETIKCDSHVQRIIEERISGFPSKIKESYHYTTLYVPVGVASLLKADEKLIAPAVRSFCNRDLIDIKACRAMKYFPPENRVYTRVKFTKLLYVMLVSSKFTPDRRTGWNLPSTNEENYKSHLLGIKLACGFEILLSQAKNSNEEADVNDLDFAAHPNWKKFLKSLSSRNYFRGLLEHSKQYNELLDTAKEYYRSSFEKSPRLNKAKYALELLSKIDIDIDEFKNTEMDLPKSDDDSWMNITQEDLDSLLETRFGCQGANATTNDCKSVELSKHINNFIHHTSGIDGAEFPTRCTNFKNSLSPKRASLKKRKTVKFSPDTKTKEVASEDGSSNANNVKFETEGFVNAIQNILNFSIPDDNYWESEGSGMSSYEDDTDLELDESLNSSRPREKNELIEYMKEMDEELSHTTIGQSFITKNAPFAENNEDDNLVDIEEFKPVDIDVNTLKNIVSSYRAQMGNPGPAENLLGPLGVNLDDIDADVD